MNKDDKDTKQWAEVVRKKPKVKGEVYKLRESDWTATVYG